MADQFTPGGAGGPGFPPQSQPNQQQRVNVDPSTLESFSCKRCGNFTFQGLVAVKKISALDPLNTTGNEMLVPVQILSCTNCGHIPDEFGGKAVPKDDPEADTGTK